MEKIQTELSTTTRSEVFDFLREHLQSVNGISIVKTYNQVIQNGKTRQVTESYNLESPIQKNNKLILIEHGNQSILSEENDPQIVPWRSTLYGLIITGLQLQGATRLIIEYLDHWQDLVDNILSELQKIESTQQATVVAGAGQPDTAQKLDGAFVRYGTDKNLSRMDVKNIVKRCKAFTESGGKVTEFWRDYNENKYSLGTLRKWLKDKSFW
jgi:hypothetical protein